ncbi:hypothetical protein GFS03_04235 [Sulfolobus sp. E5-1-F]|uniref:hypothetical protein n=1 Tax=Saccharolobus sp. E5-1-F TaxID=2663019 RepID=UPI00129785EE|nr:hypothetical protein [Sulfolobus sp. E5-1-F]QGA53843.1 hypothetical protein GFS03_04235 [Sulfolobus sp. E5-1-F]
MGNRDTILLNKVGKYYLQYIGVFSFSTLLKLFKEGKEINDVDATTINYIRSYIVCLGVRSTIKNARKALRDRITYRELGISFDREIRGRVSISHSILSLPKRLYAFYSYFEGYNAPEYFVMGNLLRRIIEIAKKYLDSHNKELLETLRKIAKKFPKGELREELPTDPIWLKNVFNIYYILSTLDKINIGVRGDNEAKIVEFITWKLYELYIFYLVLNYLRERGKSIRGINGGIEISQWKIYFNRRLKNSSLNKVDDLDSIDKFKGRPDISILNANTIIIECKYSNYLPYITAGRFKIMAYTFEYNPATAILVYPGLEEDSIEYDSEDEGTKFLDKKAKEKGFVDFQYNNKTLYIAIIDPAKDDDENMKLLARILDQYIH